MLKLLSKITLGESVQRYVRNAENSDKNVLQYFGGFYITVSIIGVEPLDL